MKSRTRYALLAGCITFFLIATPLIVIFVGGYRYNSAIGGFSQTGAISAQSDPKGAILSVNGKTYGKTPRIVRFLNPGVYTVSLSRPDYFTWTKNLGVFSQDVTLAHLGYNAVTLFFSSPKVTQVTANMSLIGFTSGSNSVAYASAQTVYVAGVSDPNDVLSSAALPKDFSSATGIRITSSPDEDYFLLSAEGTTATATSAEAVFVPDEQKVYPIQTSFNDATAEFGDHGDLFAVQGQNLVAVNWRDGANASIITAEPVEGFTWHDSYLYVISRQGIGSALLQMDTDGTHTSTLASGLPIWQHATPYLNQVNQFVILGDGTLYGFTGTPANQFSGASGTPTPSLQQIDTYVNGIVVEPSTNKFFYYTENEIGTYDPSTASLAPITRISQPITSPGASLSTGWAFYIANDRLQIIEIDTRGSQNIYDLGHVSDDATSIVSPDATFLYLLQDGSLERLQLR